MSNNKNVSVMKLVDLLISISRVYNRLMKIQEGLIRENQSDHTPDRLLAE